MSAVIAEVELVRKYIKKSEIKNLYKNNKDDYETHLKQKFSNFSEKKPFLFDMAISQEKFDYDKLKEFCSVLNKVNSGKMTSENASKYIGQKYYDQYVKGKVEDKVEEVEEEPEPVEEKEIPKEEETPKKKFDLEYV
jgi:hypothetical protein